MRFECVEGSSTVAITDAAATGGEADSIIMIVLRTSLADMYVGERR